MSEEGTARPLSIKERIAALNKTISDVSSMSPGPLSPSTSSGRGGAPRRTHQPSVLSSTGKFGENEATSASTADGADKALESSSHGLGETAGRGVAALRAGLSMTLKPSTPHDNRIVGGIALPLPLSPTPLASNNDPSRSTPGDGATRVVSVGRTPGKGIQRLAQLQISSSTSNQIGLVAGHPLLGTLSRSGPSQEIDMNLKSPSKEGEISGSSSIIGSGISDPLGTTPTPKKRGTSAIEQRLAALGGEAALMMASPNRQKPPPPGGVALPSLCATPHSIGGSNHHHHNNSSLSDSTGEAATRAGFSFLSPSNSSSTGRTTLFVTSPSKGDEVGEGPRKLEHATMSRVTLQRPRRRTAGAASPKVTVPISAGVIEPEDRKEKEFS